MYRGYNKRHRDIVACRPGEDELVNEILNCNSSGPTYDLYAKALKLYESKLHKNYIEACLLASDDVYQISELLEIPVNILEMYRKVFYDVVGLDKISRLSLVNTRDQEESALKLWGASLGLEFLAWRLGKGSNISPVDGLKEVFNTCIYKSKEALFNSNSTVASRESTKWVKLSIEIGKLLKVWVMDSSAAKQDLEIALKEISPDFESLEDLDGIDPNDFLKK